MTETTRQQLKGTMSDLIDQHALWLDSDGQIGHRLTALRLEPLLEAHRAWLEESEHGVRLDLRLADLRGADLRGIDASRANLDLTDLREAEFQGATLIGAKLRYADLGQANLERADLRGADLGNAAMEGAELSHADLRGANLRSVDLLGAVLRKADLSNARIDLGDLEAADLSDASLSMTELRIARLCDANLTGAQFGLANISEADFSGAGATQEQLRDAMGMPARDCFHAEGEDKLRRLIESLERRLSQFEDRGSKGSESDRGYREALERRLLQLQERLTRLQESADAEDEMNAPTSETLDQALEVFAAPITELDRGAATAARRVRDLTWCGALLWGIALALLLPLFAAAFRDSLTGMSVLALFALLGAPLLAFLMGNGCLRRAERVERGGARLRDRKHRCDAALALLRAEIRLGGRNGKPARIAGNLEALRALLVHEAEPMYSETDPRGVSIWGRLFGNGER